MNDRPSVAIVAGTRPEVLKLAPVFRALKAADRTEVHWIHTGARGDLATEMLRCFGILPGTELLRCGSAPQDCRAQLEALRRRQAWDACIVQGDGDGAALAAACALQAGVPLVHVDAGARAQAAQGSTARSAALAMDRGAALHCAPTQRACIALGKAGAAPGRVLLTGSTVPDAQRWICALRGIAPVQASARRHLLVTLQRPEDDLEATQQVCHAIADIAAARPELRIVFAAHLNAAARAPVRAIIGRLPAVMLVPPLDFVTTQRVLARALLLVTDSGELQEQAPAFAVPTLVLRQDTQRPEAVEAGCALFVGHSRGAIAASVLRLLTEPGAAEAMRGAGNPFGDGLAAQRIAAGVHALLGVSGPHPALFQPDPRPGTHHLLHGEPTEGGLHHGIGRAGSGAMDARFLY